MTQAIDTGVVQSRTHAIILAAGLGSRLKENTRERPKCLVEVSGHPILERMLQHLDALGVKRVTLVVGYLHEEIRAFVAQWLAGRTEGLRVDFVHNPDYAQTGSVYSLNLALDAADARREQDDLLLIEGDVVIDRDLLASLLQGSAESDAATLLAPHSPELSGTFATVSRGLVSAWLHESVRPRGFDLSGSFKTVNLTSVLRGAPRAALLAAVVRAIDTGGRTAPLEYAMQDLVGSGFRIRAVDTRDHAWFEVDTPDDLAIAHGLFPRALAAA